MNSIQNTVLFAVVITYRISTVPLQTYNPILSVSHPEAKKKKELVLIPLIFLSFFLFLAIFLFISFIYFFFH